MINRYQSRTIFTNSNNLYENYFFKRNVKLINQYNSPNYLFSDIEDLKKIKTVEHYWSTGDKYYKLADKYYGDPRDWWIIAKFNNLPTESHIKIGDLILIPTPLSTVIQILRG